MMRTMSHVAHVTDKTFRTEVLQPEIPVVVDFWAPWCGPCRMMSPVIEAAAESLAGKVKFVKVNTDENVEFAGLYGVMAIPTMIVFHKGEEKDRIVGYVPQDELEAQLRVHHEPPAKPGNDGPSCPN